jgi:D-3-phosphoglycerate dehydrogenase / 2-oxoglutarate reductase
MPSSPIPIPSKSTHAVSVSPKVPSLLLERLQNNSFLSLGQVRQHKVLHPIDNGDLRILLLENISSDAVKAFQANGWQVDHHTKSMNEDDLVQQIGQYDAIGIRSKTKITERVIKAASKVRVSMTRLDRRCVSIDNRAL